MAYIVILGGGGEGTPYNGLCEEAPPETRTVGRGKGYLFQAGAGGIQKGWENELRQGKALGKLSFRYYSETTTTIFICTIRSFKYKSFER